MAARFRFLRSRRRRSNRPASRSRHRVSIWRSCEIDERAEFKSRQVRASRKKRPHFRLTRCERIGESQLDECLARYTDSLCLAIDGAKQVDGKVDIYPLDFTARPRSVRQIKMRGQVFAR